MGALWYLLRIVPLQHVGHALVQASVPLVLAGLVAQILVRVVNAQRIRIIARAQGAPLSFPAILTVLHTTAFYGLMLPGSLGAGAATLVKYLGHGVTPAAALASMIVNRLLDTSTVVMLGLLFWALEHRDAQGDTQRHIAAALLVAGPLVLIGFPLALFGRARIVQRFARNIRGRLGTRRHGTIVGGLDKVIDQCAAAANLSAGAACSVTALSIVKNLLGVLAAYYLARACNVTLDFVTIGWMQAAVGLLVLLPVTVSGLGVREGALVLLSSRYGVAAPQALSWSLLQFGGTLFIAAIGGLIEARALWYRRPHPLDGRS